MMNSERRDCEMAYIADSDTFGQMIECQIKLKKVNTLDRWEYQKVAEAFKKVIPDSENVFVVLPFYCEYGTHIKLGKNFSANYNCVMLDVAPRQTHE